MRPSLVPTYTLSAFGMAMAVATAALGNGIRALQAPPLFREMWTNVPPIAIVSPFVALVSKGG
jgi:hypothetical protein